MYILYTQRVGVLFVHLYPLVAVLKENFNTRFAETYHVWTTILRVPYKCILIPIANLHDAIPDIHPYLFVCGVSQEFRFDIARLDTCDLYSRFGQLDSHALRQPLYEELGTGVYC